MTLEDYANDVGKTIDEIKALCDKIGINYQDENTLLPIQVTELPIVIVLSSEQEQKAPLFILVTEFPMTTFSSFEQ